MSEKRFEYDKCTGIKDLSIDEDDDQFLYPTQIVDLLNELNNENKELKEENERLRSLHIDIIETIVKELFYQEIFKEFLLESNIENLSELMTDE